MSTRTQTVALVGMVGIGALALVLWGVFLLWNALHTPKTSERIDELFRGRQIDVAFAYEDDQGRGSLRQVDTEPHRNITHLDVRGAGFTDNDLAYLSGHPRFRFLGELAIDSNSVTDDGVAHIRAFRKLEGLVLISSEITDEIIPHLESLSGLVYVTLSGSRRFTGRNIGRLANLPMLSHLTVSFTGIGDDAVPELSRLQQLDELYVDGTYLSEQAERELRDALPNTWIPDTL